MAKIILAKGGGKASATLTITLNASDNGSLAGTNVTVKDMYTGNIIYSFAYSGQPENVKVKVGTPYAIVGEYVTSYSAPATVNGVAYEDTTVIVHYQKALRYGFKRAKSNSEPAKRIEYIYDAVGKTPAAMDLITKVFNHGSWEGFINEVATPVMLRYDGTEAYELDRHDQTLKADGTASDVSNSSFNGNAMVRFEKWKWVKRYEDDSYEYVIFSNEQYDETYLDDAFTNVNGDHMDRMYYAMFKGGNVSSKLRSIAGLSVMVNQTRNTEVTYAQANGAGWDTIYNSGWQFIADLLTLIGKTDDHQTAFGSGRCKTSNSSAIATGTLKNQYGFWGTNDETSDVKVFWVEGFYGNVWEGMRGCILSGGKILTKMYPPYNFDGAGYTNTGITPSGTSGGYVNTASVTNESGYVPKTASGSGTTYYCDGLWFDTSKVTYALVGGYWAYGLLVGSRCLTLYDAASNTIAAVGSRLSYLPFTA